MVRPGALYQRIGGWLEPLGLSPFLQRGLGIGTVGLPVRYEFFEMALDKFIGLAHAAVEKNGADNGFGHVAQNSFLIGTARARFAVAQDQFGPQIELAGNLGAGFLAHKRIERAAQLGFIGLREFA